MVVPIIAIAMPSRSHLEKQNKTKKFSHQTNALRLGFVEKKILRLLARTAKFDSASNQRPERSQDTQVLHPSKTPKNKIIKVKHTPRT
jgi:hypothetical protein